MTEKTEKPKQQEKHTQKSDRSNLQKHTDQKSSYFLVYVSLIISLAALFLAIYSFKQVQTKDKSLNQDLLLTNKTINSLVGKQQELKQIIDQAGQSSEKQLAAFESKLSIFQKAMKSMGQTSNKGSTDWQLKKARFYLQLAQINAHWSQQPQITIDLLKQADEILANQNQPDIYDIRQQIANDIAAINKQSKLDIVGLLTRITAIQTQLQNLTYRDNPLLDSKENVGQEQTVNKGKWQQHWENSVQALEKLVVIRRHNKAVKPLLSDQQFGLVIESLYIELQQAKWAVIHRNQAAFKLAINHTLNQIRHHFNEQKTDVANIVRQLQSLQKIQIQQKSLVPDKALMLLDEYLQASNVPVEKKAPSGGKN